MLEKELDRRQIPYELIAHHTRFTGYSVVPAKIRAHSMPRREFRDQFEVCVVVASSSWCFWKKIGPGR